MALGVQNLFDRQPDKRRFASVAGCLGADFPQKHPAGLDGGAYYLRFSAAFWVPSWHRLLSYSLIAIAV